MLKLAGALVLLVLLGLASCGPKDEYSNSLTFGTGIMGFDLSGEASSFSLGKLGGQSLWFRLESAEDIDGRFVRLYFDKLTNKDYPTVQPTGHITVSSFGVSNTGTFQVSGHYVKTVIDIGQETLISSATLQITP